MRARAISRSYPVAGARPRRCHDRGGPGPTGAMCARLGLDQYQVRRYDAWYRHVTLCLVAGATSCSTTDLDDRAGQPVPVGPRPGQPAPRSALPRTQPGPPARYRPPVFVVPRAEPALQLRLLQPVDPGDQRERDETHVPQQVWPPQQNRLAEDRDVEREVYGVAHVPVQAADDEVRGRCDGCRGTEPFDHEPGERGHQY